MSATSPVNGIVYPDLTNVKDQVAQFATMNTNIDTSIVPRFVNASDRAARITSPTEGQFAYLTQESILTQYNGTAWVTAEMNKTIVKTVNESITASSLAANADDTLYFYGEANSVYRFELMAYFSGPSAIDAIAGAWTGPTGSTMEASMQVAATGNYNINASNVRAGNVIMGGESSQGGHTGAGWTSFWWYKGVFTTSTTPGLIQWNWRKPTAYAGTLSVLAGSHLIYSKIS